MRSWAVNNEIDIEITKEEAESLRALTLEGIVKVRLGQEEEMRERKISLKKGEINSHQLYVEIKTLPEDAQMNDIECYEITLSEEGHSFLLRNNYSVDRMYASPSSKVSLTIA